MMAAALPDSPSFHYTENLSLGHDVWDTYYPLPNGKPYFDWMFSQSSNVAPNIGSVAGGNTLNLSGVYAVAGTGFDHYNLSGTGQVTLAAGPTW